MVLALSKGPEHPKGRTIRLQGGGQEVFPTTKNFTHTWKKRKKLDPHGGKKKKNLTYFG